MNGRRLCLISCLILWALSGICAYQNDTMYLDSIVTFRVMPSESSPPIDTSRIALQQIQYDEEARVIRITEFELDDMGIANPVEREDIDYDGNTTTTTELEFEDGIWVPSEREIVTDTEEELLEIEEEYDEDATAWIPDRRIRTIKGEFGQSSVTWELWSGGIYDTLFQNTYTYDDLGRLVVSGTSTSFSRTRRHHYYRGTTDLRTVDTVFTKQGDSYVPSEAARFVYPAGSDLASHFLRTEPQSTSPMWDTIRVFEFEYDAEGNEILSDWYEYEDGTRDRLVNQTRREYFTDGLLATIHRLQFDDDLDTLVTFIFRAFEYDDSQRIVRRTDRRAGTAPFHRETTIRYERDLLQSFRQVRDIEDDGGLASSYEYDVYHYSPEATVPISYGIEPEIVRIYPNPAVDVIRVEGLDHMSTRYSWYDLTGKLLGRGALSISEEINLPNQSTTVGNASSTLLLVLENDQGRPLQMAKVLTTQ